MIRINSINYLMLKLPPTLAKHIVQNLPLVDSEETVNMDERSQVQ